MSCTSSQTIIVIDQEECRMDPPVILVIPCYNEATRLPVSKFTAFAYTRPAVRFLFVDDGSTDKTWQVLEGLHQDDPQHFALCHLTENSGKAEAVRQGVLRAFEANPAYIGYWDADLATPLETLVAFCELLGARPDLEMIFGARVQLLGRVIERRALRHYLGRAFATAASLTLGLRIYDTQCGAKLFRASPAIQALFQSPFATRWLIDVELLARLIQARQGTALPAAEEVIYEFPLPEWHDVAGSKVKAWDFATGLYGLVRIRWQYFTRGREHPTKSSRKTGR
jgi:dolichyl-phosphate beta-glucosyltransferase